MTTTHITDIGHLLDLAGVYGDYAADFDTDAVLSDYVSALDDAAGEGVHVTRSGVVYAEVDQADRARELDWKALADDIDVTAILDRHQR